MVASIADDLGRGIKTHRLRVQECRTECIRIMAFDVAAGVGNQREGRRMAFRKSVAAKAFELAEVLISTES